MSSKSTTIEVKFTGDAGGLKKAATDSGRALDELGDDAESAGKKMAKALESAADDMISEIDATKAAVDALDRALGDTGEDIDTAEAVAELKRLGLTAEDIEADADDLAGALKRAGDVKVHAKSQGFDDLDQALGRTKDGGQAASAAIGGIGGSISELPGIGALGPLAESVGQLSEGALEGETNLKQLAGAGLALGATAVVANEISTYFGEIAATKAWRKEQVENYTDALKDAEGVLDGISDKLTEQGGVFVHLFGKEQDITKVVNSVGLSVKDFTRLVEGGDEAIGAWADEMKKSGADSDALALTVRALNEESKALTASQDALSASVKFFGADAAYTEPQIDALRDSVDAYIDTTHGVPDAKTTEIQALIDDGQYTEAERRLTILSRNRDANIRIITHGGAGYGPLSGARAAGGLNGTTGDYLVGEQGPEIVTLPGGSNVTDASRTRSRLDDAAPRVVNNTTIIQHYPRGTRPAETVNDTRRYDQVQGPL